MLSMFAVGMHHAPSVAHVSLLWLEKSSEGDNAELTLMPQQLIGLCCTVQVVLLGSFKQSYS
jgi:hypothetical protein